MIYNKMDVLLKLLQNYDFKPLKGMKKCATFRHNAMTINVGYTQKVLTRANVVQKSLAMKENKDEIYNACKLLFPDFKFNAVTINKNWKCPPHFDNKNSGVSLICGLGDYTGGDLLVEGKAIDIKYKPHIFNGSLQEHSTADFQGERYSIVLFHLEQTCKWRIVIPSYKRPQELKDKTLATLARAGITEGITIFVANEEEKLLYREKIKKLRIVVGVEGLTEQRNFIKRYYKRLNSCICSMDDDIEDFQTVTGNGKFHTITDLKQMITDCFITTKNNEANFWGVYGARNVMFMERHKSRFNAKCDFLIGCCFGWIVEKDMKPYLMDERVKIKQDYEQTLLHFLAKGKTIRFNKITIKTKFYKPGGLGIKVDRLEQNKIDADLLCEKYPLYFNRKIRKCGTHEVSFKRNIKIL